MYQKSVILLAEDDPNDVFFLRRTFNKAGILNPLLCVHDGEEAIAYLAGNGKYANRLEYPLPELLLLDNRMPRVSGFEVLRWLRQQPHLLGLRVLFFISADNSKDAETAYKLGANSVQSKPLDPQDILLCCRAIRDHSPLPGETAAFA